MSTRQGRRLRLGEGKSKGESSAKEEITPDASAVATTDADTKFANNKNSSSFFSPKKSTKEPATVTPSPSAAKKRRSLLQEEVEGETEKRKSKKKKVEKKTAAATTINSEEPYVPTYIHKNVGYSRFGTAIDRLTEGQKLAFNFVVEKYIIPSDFETNRKYGPLSGISYEQRLLAAYATNDLEPRGDADSIVIRKGICTFCGCTGHRKKACPELL